MKSKISSKPVSCYSNFRKSQYINLSYDYYSGSTVCPKGPVPKGSVNFLTRLQCMVIDCLSVFTPIFLARRCLPTQIFDLLVAQTRSFPVLKFKKKLKFFYAEPYFLLLSTTLCPALIWGDTVDILISNSIYKPCSCRFLNHVSSFPHDTGT